MIINISEHIINKKLLIQEINNKLNLKDITEFVTIYPFTIEYNPSTNLYHIIF